MKVKVFYPNREGKIEFTRQELEKLLDEVYREGQKDCNCGKSWTWTTPYYNGSLTSNSTTNTTVTTPNLSTATHSTDTKAIDNFKASLKEAEDAIDACNACNAGNKPLTVTMKINEADVNKAAEAFKAMFDQKGALTPQKVNDVFSGLAKELNF